MACGGGGKERGQHRDRLQVEELVDVDRVVGRRGLLLALGGLRWLLSLLLGRLVEVVRAACLVKVFIALIGDSFLELVLDGLC